MSEVVNNNVEPVVAEVKAEVPVVEEVKNEVTEEPKKEEQVNNETETLKAQIAELQKQLEVVKELQDKITNMTTEKDTLTKQLEEANKSKDGMQELITKVANYEAAINDQLTKQIESIPENLRTLIPETMAVQEKLQWITKAKEAGLFGVEKVEIGKPMNPAKAEVKVDTSKLTPSELLSMAYANKK